jgi:predicted amidophosphoribosyltransferase
LDCGHIFDDGEEARWTENVGEFWGAPAMERMTGCPLCRGDYEATTPCEICGSEHLDDELISGICEECLEEYRYDINTCFEIGKAETESIELNSFIVSLFDREEIEEILLKALLQEEKIHGKVDCQKFIDVDKSWFAERLAEEVKK